MVVVTVVLVVTGVVVAVVIDVDVAARDVEGTLETGVVPDRVVAVELGVVLVVLDTVLLTA